MHFRIGDAARQSGLTAHVLRQWSKRYGMHPSVMSDGGHRLYSREDVKRLKLVKRAKSQGMLLRELATLSVGSLEAITQGIQTSRSVLWIGAGAAHFKTQFARLNWLDTDTQELNHETIVVLQEDTVTEEWLNALPNRDENNAFVFYDFASRTHLKQLAALGYECIKGQPSFDWFRKTVEPNEERRDFSSEDIEELMQIESNLDCECPAHLAALVKSLRAFSQYSLECETNTEAESWIHRRVYEHTQKAQIEIEKALTLIANEEGF